jgi:hypothetical protein
MAVWEQIIQRSGKGDKKFADNSMKHQGVPVLLIAMVYSARTTSHNITQGNIEKQEHRNNMGKQSASHMATIHASRTSKKI